MHAYTRHLITRTYRLCHSALPVPRSADGIDDIEAVVRGMWREDEILEGIER